MVDELHKNDIAVIMDMVYNHVGNDQNAFGQSIIFIILTTTITEI